MSSPNGFVTGVIALVVGSKTFDGFDATQPSMSNSLPLVMRMLCAATKPQSMTGDHCPTSPAVGGGGCVPGPPDEPYRDAVPSDQRVPGDQVAGSAVSV